MKKLIRIECSSKNLHNEAHVDLEIFQEEIEDYLISITIVKYMKRNVKDFDPANINADEENDWNSFFYDYNENQIKFQNSVRVLVDGKKYKGNDIDFNVKSVSPKYALVIGTEDEGTRTLEDYDTEEYAVLALEFIKNNGHHCPEYSNGNDADIISFNEYDKATFGLDVEIWEDNIHAGFGTIEHTPVVIHANEFITRGDFVLIEQTAKKFLSDNATNMDDIFEVSELLLSSDGRDDDENPNFFYRIKSLSTGVTCDSWFYSDELVKQTEKEIAPLVGKFAKTTKAYQQKANVDLLGKIVYDIVGFECKGVANIETPNAKPIVTYNLKAVDGKIVYTGFTSEHFTVVDFHVNYRIFAGQECGENYWSPNYSSEEEALKNLEFIRENGYLITECSNGSVIEDFGNLHEPIFHIDREFSIDGDLLAWGDVEHTPVNYNEEVPFWYFNSAREIKRVAESLETGCVMSLLDLMKEAESNIDLREVIVFQDGTLNDIKKFLFEELSYVVMTKAEMNKRLEEINETIKNAEETKIDLDAYSNSLGISNAEPKENKEKELLSAIEISDSANLSDQENLYLVHLQDCDPVIYSEERVIEYAKNRLDANPEEKSNFDFDTTDMNLAQAKQVIASFDEEIEVIQNLLDYKHILEMIKSTKENDLREVKRLWSVNSILDYAANMSLFPFEGSFADIEEEKFLEIKDELIVYLKDSLSYFGKIMSGTTYEYGDTKSLVFLIDKKHYVICDYHGIGVYCAQEDGLPDFNNLTDLFVEYYGEFDNSSREFDAKDFEKLIAECRLGVTWDDESNVNYFVKLNESNVFLLDDKSFGLHGSKETFFNEGSKPYIFSEIKGAYDSSESTNTETTLQETSENSQDEVNPNEFNCFWKDPEGKTSDACKIVRFPYSEDEALLSELEINAYGLIEACEELYDENNGYNFGLQYGLFTITHDSIGELSIEWFKTEDERTSFIKLNLINDKRNFIMVGDINPKNPYVYNQDDIFLIQTINGGEAEVWNTELETREQTISLAEHTKGQVVRINHDSNCSYFDDMPYANHTFTIEDVNVVYKGFDFPQINYVLKSLDDGKTYDNSLNCNDLEIADNRLARNHSYSKRSLTDNLKDADESNLEEIFINSASVNKSFEIVIDIGSDAKRTANVNSKDYLSCLNSIIDMEREIIIPHNNIGLFNQCFGFKPVGHTTYKLIRTGLVFVNN